MISLPLRAEYLEMGKSFVDNERNVHDEAFEVVHEDLHDDVFFNLFWVVHLPLSVGIEQEVELTDKIDELVGG